MKYRLFSAFLLLVGGLSSLWISDLGAAQTNNKDKCNVSVTTKWTPTEKWVWEKLCDGTEADLSKYDTSISLEFLKTILIDKTYSELLPTIISIKDAEFKADLSKYGTKTKKISLEFLKAILIDKTYSELLPTIISIKDAEFKEKIELKSEEIGKQVNLQDSTFEKLVDLSNSNFKRSLSFEGSTFQGSMVLKDSVVEGPLSFDDTKFTNNNNKCVYEYPLLDLTRIQVKSDLNLRNITFKCYQEFHKKAKEQESTSQKSHNELRELINLINLKASKIRVSVNITNVLFNEDSSKLQSGGISLIAAEVGDAILLNQTFSNKQKKDGYGTIDFVNLSSITAKSFVFFIPSYLNNTLSDYRIYKLFNGESDGDKETLSFKNYLSQFEVNLENANINTITIVANTNDNIEPKPTASSKKNNEGCNVKLGGLNYNQVNKNAYKLLTICIDSF